jgi:hypothetical protein
MASIAERTVILDTDYLFHKNYITLEQNRIDGCE